MKSGHKCKECHVSSDLWRPTLIQTISESWYMITFTDDYSRWTWVSFLKHKSDAYKAFEKWKAKTENSSGKSLATFCSDNGWEYLNKLWVEYVKENSVWWETTPPYTLEQNGVAECLNCSIFNHVQTVLADTGLPLFLWAEVANYIVYMRNRHTTCALANLISYQQHFSIIPDLSHLHHFGCATYVYDNSKTHSKLDPRGKPTVFVGYLSTQKAWHFYLPEKQVIHVTMHVKFNDDCNAHKNFLAERSITSLITHFSCPYSRQMMMDLI